MAVKQTPLESTVLVLSIEGVTVVIAEKTLLDVQSLTLFSGEVLGVIGPNGAGKSTLLKVCSGERVANTGIVKMNGISLDNWTYKDRALTRAVLPQSSSLMFDFKVIDVVLMGRCPFNAGQFNLEDRRIAEQAMLLTDTTHLLDRFYPQLSGGEKQRVHLARVIAQLWNQEQSQIRYLLLDEPTSALDLSHQHKTLSIARAFTREQNVAALIVLHDLNLAALYVDKLAMMYEGKIVAYGTPQEVLKAETIEQVFDYPVIVNKHPLQAQIPLVITSGFSNIKMDAAL